MTGAGGGAATLWRLQRRDAPVMLAPYTYTSQPPVALHPLRDIHVHVTTCRNESSRFYFSRVHARTPLSFYPLASLVFLLCSSHTRASYRIKKIVKPKTDGDFLGFRWKG